MRMRDIAEDLQWYKPHTFWISNENLYTIHSYSGCLQGHIFIKYYERNKIIVDNFINITINQFFFFIIFISPRNKQYNVLN